MITYSQNLEDVLLARVFSRQEGGTYVDIGASHPEELSVTKHFYDHGWRGVNVEPIARNHQLFVRDRPEDDNLQAAVGAARGRRTFHECSDFDALSTFDAAQAQFLRSQGHAIVSYEVDTVTCDDVMARLAGRTVDFLKIDVEGLEAEVLGSLDLERHRPRVLVVEATRPAHGVDGWWNFESVATWHAWEPRLLAARYRFAYFDGVSRFYVREESAELLPAFSVPVGVFDDYRFPSDAPLVKRLEKAERDVREQGDALRGVNEALAAARDLVVKRDWRIKEAEEAYRVMLGERDALRSEHEATRAELEGARAELEGARAERDALGLRLREVEAQRASAVASYEHAAAQLAALESMTLGQRIAALGRYAKEVARDVLVKGAWRVAQGGRPAPLPRITLVTPVLNGVHHIAETMESVLRQEYPFLEYVVVDGGSTDGTLDVIRAWAARTDLPHRIARFVSEPDRGMYDAVGKGLDGASGEVLGYLNADDLLEPGALLAVGRQFASHPRVKAIFHEDTVLVNGWKYPNVRQPHRVTTDDLLGGHILFQDGVFFRKALYEAAGGVRRDLKLAGDYDLWLRMCSLARFVRRDSHVSCFRVRSGQLSGDMAKYNAEMRRARADFLRGKGVARRAYWKLVGVATRLGERLLRRRDALFFPIDFANMPPPEAIAPPPPGEAAARSPVDGSFAERLLFSTIDNRFGDRELNYIYLDSRHRIAVTYPPVAPEKLDALYRKNYSSPPTRIVHAEGNSPYRRFDRRRLWHKVLFHLPIEHLKFLRMPSWDDTTLQDLWAVLRDAGVQPNRALRVLDTGCFEGHLLDRIRAETPWRASGIEPNERAVAIARSRGHEVWQAHAEGAHEAVPRERQFDVIFMGQSIEHVDDPVRVLRRLRLLLAPGGVLVVSTPNLDSHQVRWFGPTWAHWHPPYHRYIFSKRGLHALAREAGLHARRCRTFSHPYWTAMSIALHALGLGAVVPHAVEFDIPTRKAAQRVDWWARWWWNRRGEGDYAFLVMAEDEHG